MANVMTGNLYINKSLKTTVHLQKILHFISTTIKPDFVDQSEVHDFWEIVYLESGEATAYAGGEARHLLAGDAIFHKPGEEHSIKAIGGEITVFFISFYSKSKMMQVFDGLKLPLSTVQKGLIYKLYDEARCIFSKGCRPQDTKAFVSKELLYDTPLGAQQLYRLYLEEFLIICAREKEQNITVFENKKDFEKIIVEKIIEVMLEKLYDSFSIDYVCTALNYSKTYLSTLFKKHRGSSIMRFYNQLKIKEAKKLLITKSVSETSNLLTFSSPYYFTKVFKKVEGISPSTYKKRL